MNGPFVLHCDWCGRPMREACKCAERLCTLVELGITKVEALEAILEKDAPPAPPEKAETWRDRPPLL